jgi:hypothetical protein
MITLGQCVTASVLSKYNTHNTQAEFNCILLSSKYSTYADVFARSPHFD